MAPKRKPRRTGPTSDVLELVRQRSGGYCEFQGCWETAVHTHHRRPRRMGGTRRLDANQAPNLLRLCLAHHEWVESNRTLALDSGLLLHDGADPAEEPVESRHGLVFLDDEGGWTSVGVAA